MYFILHTDELFCVSVIMLIVSAILNPHPSPEPYMSPWVLFLAVVVFALMYLLSYESEATRTDILFAVRRDGARGVESVYVSFSRTSAVSLFVDREIVADALVAADRDGHDPVAVFEAVLECVLACRIAPYPVGELIMHIIYVHDDVPFALRFYDAVKWHPNVLVDIGFVGHFTSVESRRVLRWLLDKRPDGVPIKRDDVLAAYCLFASIFREDLCQELLDWMVTSGVPTPEHWHVTNGVGFAIAESSSKSVRFLRWEKALFGRVPLCRKVNVYDWECDDAARWNYLAPHADLFHMRSPSIIRFARPFQLPEWSHATRGPRPVVTALALRRTWNTFWAVADKRRVPMFRRLFMASEIQ